MSTEELLGLRKPKLFRRKREVDEIAQRIRRKAMAELFDLEKTFAATGGKDYWRAKKIRRYIDWLRAKAKEAASK